MKYKLESNVYEEAVNRVNYIFDNFEKICISFSGGKDSTVMLHIVMDEAKKRNKRVGLLLVDLEGQYKLTITHIETCLELYKEYLDIYWVCLPIHLRNAVSVYEPFWKCWDIKVKDMWIRDYPKNCINDIEYFDFFKEGMEFEEFVPLFAKWYSQGKSTVSLIGIRADESLNRYRTIASNSKIRYKDKIWTTKISENIYNAYPIYDMAVEDIWVYHAKNPIKPYNKLYDLMYKSGLSLSQMRICQPYGDDQRRSLWLFHLIEPETWSKVVARVNGANSGALYIQESGNINGYRNITKPKNHSWKSFTFLLLNSMPIKTKEHYENKIIKYLKWWKEHGYEDGILDININEKSNTDIPSWYRICKCLLRNDYWCKGLGFSQTKSNAYLNYLELMKKKKQEWNINIEHY